MLIIEIFPTMSTTIFLNNLKGPTYHLLDFTNTSSPLISHVVYILPVTIYLTAYQGSFVNKKRYSLWRYKQSPIKRGQVEKETSFIQEKYDL